MTDIYDYQFELDGVPFGIGFPISLDAGGFSPGTVEWTNRDMQVSGTDSNQFGKDYASGGPTWGFQLHADQTYTAEAALAAKRALAGVWPREDIRLRPRAVQWLRYAVGGEVRRVAGRPRAWTASPDNAILSGMLPITADFKLAAPLFFGDVEKTLEISQAATASQGGFRVPFTLPLTTYNPNQTPRPGVLLPDDVGGDLPAPFTATLHGPGLNLGLAATDGSWEISTIGSLGRGETIEISTYPWNPYVLKNGVAGINRTRKTKLQRARLAPGGASVRFTGSYSDPEARALVRWHSTYKDW